MDCGKYLAGKVRKQNLFYTTLNGAYDAGQASKTAKPELCLSGFCIFAKTTMRCLPTPPTKRYRLNES